MLRKNCFIARALAGFHRRDAGSGFQEMMRSLIKASQFLNIAAIY